MKKLVISILALLLGTFLFATTFKVEVKGSVYVKSDDGDVYELKDESTVTDEDTLIVGEKSSVILFADGTKIVIRAAGAYKIKDVIK